jgi:hypothetical protein
LAEPVSVAALAGRPNDKARTSTPARMIRTLRTAIAPSGSYPHHPERDDTRPLPEYLEPPKIHRSAQRVSYANGLVANGWDARLLDDGLHSDGGARRGHRDLARLTSPDRPSISGPSSSGSYTFVAGNSGLCLDAPSSSSGVQLVQSTCNSTTAQAFSLLP